MDRIAAQAHVAAFLPRRYGIPDDAYVAHAKSIARIRQVSGPAPLF